MLELNMPKPLDGNDHQGSLQSNPKRPKTLKIKIFNKR
jgi:hypothetical protein